jgi:hypothetical protein
MGLIGRGVVEKRGVAGEGQKRERQGKHHAFALSRVFQGRTARCGITGEKKDLNKWWCGFRLARAFLYMMEETEERARRCAAVPPPPPSIANWRSGRGRKQKAA